METPGEAPGGTAEAAVLPNFGLNSYGLVVQQIACCDRFV